MTVIELSEHGPARSFVLPDATGRAIAMSRLVDAAPDPYLPGHWRVRAGGKVGVATITVPDHVSVTLRIAPKVTIDRLMFLLGYSQDVRGWRHDDVQVREAQQLLPALARVFERQTETALRQGLIQGYRTTEETSLVVRGRIRNAEQIRKHHGRMLPVETAHDDYTADIAENQILATACERLCRLPAGVPRDVRGSLLRLRARLPDVTTVPRGREAPEWRPTRLNARYHRALRVAELVLRGASVEHLSGDVTVNGFIFDMARVFEDFLSIALRAAWVDEGGRCAFRTSHHLDELDRVRIVPDIVRYRDDGTPLTVIDAKYKAEKPGGFPDADLYQMLAYCTALGLSEGHLVYAKGIGPHTKHHIRHAGITIHQHALDLDQPPTSLLADVRTLARAMRSSARALHHA